MALTIITQNGSNQYAKVELCLDGGLHLPGYDLESGEIACLNGCGLVFDSSALVRDLPYEIDTHKPSPHYEMGGGLGTDLAKAVFAIRRQSFMKVSRRLDGRESPADRAAIVIAENRISPGTQSWLNNQLRRDRIASLTLLKDEGRKLVARYLEQLRITPQLRDILRLVQANIKCGVCNSVSSMKPETLDFAISISDLPKLETALRSSADVLRDKTEVNRLLEKKA